MSKTLKQGLVLAVALAALAACETGPSAAQIEAERVAAEAAAAAALAARTPPPVALSASVAESASIYTTFVREQAALRGGFATPDAVQEALRRGSTYDPVQLSRGLIAYASIIALQSPEFLAGIRQYSVDPTARQQIINNIVADPAYAAVLPGAEQAAGLIIGTLEQDITALTDAAVSVEADAYTIQERNDPRRAWAVAHVANREARLAQTKDLSDNPMAPTATEASNLLAAAQAGTGLSVSTGTRRPPYTPAVVNALALAALAGLGAAGDDARANTEALQNDRDSQFCLNLSKLNLYQCLAASRPSYEDMFCVGRHVVRDLATCTRGSAVVAPLILVSDPVTAPARTTVNPTPVQTPVTPGR